MSNKDQIDKLREESAEEENDLKAMGIHKKISKLKKVDYFKESVLPVLKDKYVIDLINNNHYRISNMDKALDYFPPSRKVFSLNSKKWTQVFADGSILSYIDKLLQ